jgi:putative hydrolase of HD superfamily
MHLILSGTYMDERDSNLQKQIDFLVAIDTLKSVERQSRVLSGKRRENSAEHSWHVAMYAAVLCSYGSGVDQARVVLMLLLHDIVEMQVGDTPLHGAPAADQREREAEAASVIFGMLPEPQSENFKAMWDEFEAAQSSDARMAKALDRVQPLIANVALGGGTWEESKVSREQVFERYGPVIAAGAPQLWAYCSKLVDRYFAARES